MANIHENRAGQRVLEKATAYFDEDVLPVLKTEFSQHENNADLLMHSIKSGKRLRPFYCSQAFTMAGGTDREASNYAAAAMELVHCGSLMIDDELDSKEQRPDRGVNTVRAVYSPEESVFLGACLETLYAHHLLAKACRNTTTERRDAVLRTFVSTFSEGVTKEINKWKCISSHRIPSREEYWGEHIHSSGGLFFCMSGKVAALLATEDRTRIDALSEIGYCFGQVLQAGDDVKDLKQDMAQGYYSLAVINYCEMLSNDERERFRKQLEAGLRSEDIEEIYCRMVDVGAIDMKLEEIRRKGESIKMRAENFEDSEARENVVELADFLASRMRLC